MSRLSSNSSLASNLSPGHHPQLISIYIMKHKKGATHNMNPFERSVLSMKDFLNQITFRRDSWSHSCSCWMKNNFQLTALWKNHNPRKGFIHAQGFFSCRSLYFFFFFTEPELSYRFHMAPKSTDVYDDISLGFSALFPTCPCTQSLWHLCFCKDRKSVAVSSMENILELHLKETCKRSFICLEKKKENSPRLNHTNADP